MKTLILRSGETLTIRAIAMPAEEGPRDRCATLQFFQEQAQLRPKEMENLGSLLTDTANLGPPPDKTKFKELPGTDGICEFKTSGGLRLLCFRDTGVLIICTHGYLKQSQKAPKRELERAKALMARYFEAKKRGELIHGEPRKKSV